MAGAGDAPKIRLTQPTNPPSAEWYAQVARIVGALVSSGTTAERPTGFLYAGRQYYDTDLVDGAGKWIYRNADNTAWVETISASDIANDPAGRLTLETAVPVSTTDQTAKTSVFYALYKGERVPIYDGALWTPTVFTELTLALDADSGHTGYQQSGKNFDLFVVNDAGTLRLGTGPAWTSDTGRGTGAGTTELQRLNGIWTNKVSMTLRWGSASGNTITVAANCGTVVGTMRASANGQCEDSLAKRFLWNMYHRVKRPMRVLDATASWDYSTAAYRQMNAAAGNQLAFVRGLDEDGVDCTVMSVAATDQATARAVKVGIGLDGATANVAGAITSLNYTTSTNVASPMAKFCGAPGLGYHYLAALEFGGGADTQTWFGGSVYSGIAGEVMQ